MTESKRPRVKVKLADHDPKGDLHDLAKEAKRGWSSHVAVIQNSVNAARDAGTPEPGSDTVVLNVTLGSQHTVKSVHCAGPHFAPIIWATTPAEAAVADGGETTVELHGRARVSAWANAVNFHHAEKPNDANKIHPRWRDLSYAGLDDITFLVTVFNKGETDEVEWAADYLPNARQNREEFLRQAIRFFHKQNVQVFVGMFCDIGVEGPSSVNGDHFTKWLHATVKGATGPLEPLFAPHARNLVKFFDDKGLDIDGISMDHEIFPHHKTVAGKEVHYQGLTEADRPAIEALYHACADELAKRGRCLAYANSAFTSANTGISKWMPYHIARYPNVIARPMSYLANREKLMDYALGDVKLHPGQIQVGWASRSTPVAGPDNTIKQWVIPNTPATFTEECGKLERRYRVGVVQFALEKVEHPPSYAAMDAALNPDGPPAGTLGQPLQGPLNQQRMDAFAKAKTEPDP